MRNFYIMRYTFNRDRISYTGIIAPGKSCRDALARYAATQAQEVRKWQRIRIHGRWETCAGLNDAWYFANSTTATATSANNF